MASRDVARSCRLMKMIAGREIGAGPSKTVRQAGKVVREEHPSSRDRRALADARANRSMAARRLGS
jgi:hypothetical protein